ncbi:MAG: RNA-binding S4 domain-containing protein [Chthoniobacteraceae bacterium]
MTALLRKLAAMRIDQWLWAVRVFKTRNQAAEAIRGNLVEVNAHPCKPAHEVRPGETVTVHYWDHDRVLQVCGSPPSRVGAKLVPEFALDVSPPRPPKPEKLPADRWQ